MRERKYIYYVQAKVGSNSWLSIFLVTCTNIDKILPMLENSGLDNTNAYGDPKKPNITVHHVQKLALCHNDDLPESFVSIYRMYCDIKPNDYIL